MNADRQKARHQAAFYIYVSITISGTILWHFLVRRLFLMCVKYSVLISALDAHDTRR